MKILALADRKINDDLVSLVKKQGVDLVLLLGDLKYNEIQDLAEVQVPVVEVLGNHCSFNYLPNLKAHNAHLVSVSLKGLTFFGYQGCPFYKGGQFESTQEECAKSLGEKSVPCDIFIAHSPAEGINSSSSPHEGFNAFISYLKLHRPKFFFHGHSYPPRDQKVSLFEDTIVYHVEGVEIIDLNLLLGLSLPPAKAY